MIREIKQRVYKIKLAYATTGGLLVETDSKIKLYNYILDKQEKGFIVTSVTELRPDGTKPRVAFRGDSDFKKLEKERRNN